MWPYKALWCSGYHYCTTSFNNFCNQALRRFKSCLRRVGDSRWWGSLTIVSAGNKAKRLLSVNHTTKAIHHTKKYLGHLKPNPAAKCVFKAWKQRHRIHFLVNFSLVSYLKTCQTPSFLRKKLTAKSCENYFCMKALPLMFGRFFSCIMFKNGQTYFKILQ